jgi:hypothetical protein
MINIEDNYTAKPPDLLKKKEKDTSQTPFGRTVKSQKQELNNREYNNTSEPDLPTHSPRFEHRQDGFFHSLKLGQIFTTHQLQLSEKNKFSFSLQFARSEQFLCWLSECLVIDSKLDLSLSRVWRSSDME